MSRPNFGHFWVDQKTRPISVGRLSVYIAHHVVMSRNVAFILAIIVCTVSFTRNVDATLSRVGTTRASRGTPDTTILSRSDDGHLLIARQHVSTMNKPLPLQVRILLHFWESFSLLRLKVITAYNHVRVGINDFVSSWGSFMTQSTPAQVTEQQTGNVPAAPTVRVLQWGGEIASAIELSSIQSLREMIGSSAHRELVDVELLRFLRHHRWDTARTATSLQAHLAWKATMRGTEEVARRKLVLHSPLQEEIFWLGVNNEDCATLVIRTQLHDGSYFNEDPTLFESFVISRIEEGQRLYGVGTQRQMCLLIDRGGSVRRNGVPKVEVRDMAVLPRVAVLVNTIVNTVQANYPELLHSAKIAPASWFFTLCYRVISGVFDAPTRAKFEILSDAQVVPRLHALISPSLLPTHLGGTSVTFKSEIDIHWHG